MTNFWDSLGTVTSGFGNRNTGIPGASTNHKGIDIELNNDNVPAIVGGTVINKGTNASAGNWVKVQQSDGYIATYMHLAKLPSVSVGSSVATGQTIGTQGSTGNSSGKHLHYQIQDSFGNFVNPTVYDEIATNGGGFSSTLQNVGNFVTDPTGYIEDKTLSTLGVVVKGGTLVFIGVVAAFLFFQAFEIKLF